MLSYNYKNSTPIHWWLMPVILVAWESEIWRTTISDQPKQKVHETPCQPI
jgi:hypothetical protein